MVTERGKHTTMHIADIGKKLVPHFELTMHRPRSNLNNLYSKILMQPSQACLGAHKAFSNFLVEFKLWFGSGHIFSLFGRDQATMN